MTVIVPSDNGGQSPDASRRAGLPTCRLPRGLWRGVFYPPKLAQHKELWFASRHFNSIELNGSFYAMQSPSSYKSWYAATPADFKFAVKGPRYVTHIRRLKKIEAPLGNFFGSGVLHFKEKLGPILWQLPPNFLFREEELEDFFEQLPRSFGQAMQLAQKADRLTPDCPAEAPSQTPIRHAIEVRHDSFLNPDFIALLRRQDIALVIADSGGKPSNAERMMDLILNPGEKRRQAQHRGECLHP